MSISLICACKNRENTLKVSLTSWIMFKEICEIIIVDWSSDNSLEYLTKLDSRIKVVRVDNEKFFNQPQPLNLAAKIATQKYLLKFDIDYVLNPYYNFFDEHSIDNLSFLCGENECDLKKEQFYRFLWGLLYVNREVFLKIGGYNEKMDSFYSFDDQELNVRLELLGLNKKTVNYLKNTIFHIPHPQIKRIENFRSSSFIDFESKSEDFIDWVISNNYNVNFETFSPQTKNILVKPKLNWEIKQISPQIYKAKKHIL